MNKLVVMLLVFFAYMSHAQYLGASGVSLNDVVVPSIYGDPATNDRIQGMIYYDNTAGAFKGIGSSSSTPVLLSPGSGSYVSTDGGAERIERAKITWTAGVPTVTTASGAWLSSITDNGVGDATLIITNGIFSAEPTCSIQRLATATTDVNSIVFGTSNTSTAVRFMINNGSGTPIDPVAVYVICMGVR